MKPTKLKPGDLVQIDPAHDVLFGGRIMIVAEPKPWGAKGLVRMPKFDAYYRVGWEHMELVGRAEWVPGIPENANKAETTE